MRILYSVVYGLGLVLCLPLLPFHRKLRVGLLGRYRQKQPSPFSQSPFWFHVASSGELEQALSVIDRVRKKAPQIPIFISYFSPTALRALELEEARRRQAGISRSWDGAAFLPIDLSFSLRPFLDRLKPRALIIIHRELWPNCLAAALGKGIPIYWIDVTFPRGVGMWVRLLKRWIIRFTAIGCVDEPTQALLQGRFPEQRRVEVMGDSRIDRVADRKELLAPRLSLSLTSRPHRIFVLASVWPEDWRALRGPILNRLRTKNDIAIWIVPHEISRALTEKILSDFKGAGLPIAVSQTIEGLGEKSTGNLLVNVIGALAELYSVCDLVFVGGSFKGRVHNVLEPAIYGRPILTGPFIDNSVEARIFEREGALLTGPAEEFTDRLGYVLDTPNVLAKMSQCAKKSIEVRIGSATKYSELLLSQS